MVRRAVIGRDVLLGTYITVIISVPFLLPFLILNGDLALITKTSPISILLLAAMGLVHYIGGRGAYNIAVKMIGVTRATPLRETNLIHSVFYGLLLLNEKLTVLSSIAIGLISVGVLAASMSQARGQGIMQKVGSGLFLKGILIGLVGASFWGISPILIKFALPGVSSPIAASWLSFIFGSLGWTIIHLARGKIRLIPTLGRNGIILFSLAGTLAATAHVFRFSALQIADVVTIIPLAAGLGPILTLGFAYIFVRKVEGINKMVIAGIIITSIGAFVLAISS